MDERRVTRARRYASYTGTVDPRAGGAAAGLAPSSGAGARIAYAALFTVALPIALALWAQRLDALVALPRVHWPEDGGRIAGLGAALALWATFVLRRHGGGMPASAFPPERLMTRGPYRFVAHPIYIGAVLIAAGASLAAGSGAGLFIVTPVLAATCAAWVIGFERDLTRRLFGAEPQLLMRTPGDSDDAPTGWMRAGVYLRVLLPWLVVYQAIETLGPAADARETFMAWERSLPVLPWTELVYASTYPLVLLAPLVARRQRDLRALARDAACAMVLVFPLYLLLPLAATPRPVEGTGVLADLVRAERVLDGAGTAFPAFHVVWTLIALRTYVARWPRLRGVALAAAAAVAVSCVTTGIHSVGDVIAGVVAWAVVARRAVLWDFARRAAERVANSWREWTVGPVRLLVHGVYAGIGAALGVLLAVTLAGPQQLWWLIGTTVAAVVGAGVWAQVVEGSPQLLRPYGYFGSVIGVVLVAAGAGYAGAEGWLLFVAFGVGSTVTYVFGRLRCLVQGCCHGAPAAEHIGIRYTHPRSRVVRLSELGGRPVHPTPLYSIAWMLVVGAALLRLWTLAAPLPLIAGSYFILVGLGRFVEEHFRGEPQTRVIGGLRLYQWLSIAFVIGGAALTCVAGPAAPAPVMPPLAVAWPLGALALVTYAAYGLDLPRANVRYSRLV